MSSRAMRAALDARKKKASSAIPPTATVDTVSTELTTDTTSLGSGPVHATPPAVMIARAPPPPDMALESSSPPQGRGSESSVRPPIMNISPSVREGILRMSGAEWKRRLRILLFK